MRLMRADFGASYIWHADNASFQNSVNYNMDPANLKRYDDCDWPADISIPVRAASKPIKPGGNGRSGGGFATRFSIAAAHGLDSARSTRRAVAGCVER